MANRDPDILSNYFKNKTKEIPKILSATSKTKQGMSEILLNYVPQKQNARCPRDSFKLLQKSISKTEQRRLLRFIQITSERRRKESQTFFQTTSKTKDKESPTFFQTRWKSRKKIPWFLQTTLKTKQRIPEIHSNYFKNKTPGVLEILPNYFKNKTRDP